MQGKSDKFLFCFEPNNAQSLVILKKSDDIFDQMTKLQQTVFVWISAVDNKVFTNNQIIQLQKELDIPIKIYDSIDSFKKAILGKLIGQSIIVVVSQEWENRSLQLLRKNEVKGIICFPADQSKKFQLEEKFIISINQKQFFLETLKQNRSKVVQYREFPTFVSTINEIRSCNVHVRTMYAMLKLKQNKDTRRMIVNQLEKLFEKLAESCYEFKHYNSLSQKFINQIRENSLNEIQALKWYTCQSTVYKLTNNLLRSVRNPTEAFYIQPFFKDLFQAVSNIFIKQKQNKQQKCFKCFRGAQISQKDFEGFKKNVGSVMQNLGFLSTSTNLQAANIFFSNVLFEIQVKDVQRLKDCDFGYAHIKSKSQYCFESEILFNPLNFFRVIEATARQTFGSPQYYIKLDYGVVVRGDNNKYQEQMVFVIKNLIFTFRQVNLCQGDILFREDEYMQGYEQYWHKCLQLSQGNTKILRKAIYNLGIIYKSKNKFQRALQFFEQNQKLITQNQGQQSYEYSQNRMQLGMTLINTNMYQKGIYILKQLFRKLDMKNQCFSKEKQILVLNSLGAACYDLKRYQQSQFFFKSGLKLAQKNYQRVSIVLLISFCNVLVVRGNYAKVEPYYKNLLVKINRIWGKQSIFYLQTQQLQATLHFLTGNYHKSLIFYNICKVIHERKKIIDMNWLMNTKRMMGNINFHLFSYQKAIKLYEQCLQLTEQQKNKNDIQNLQTQYLNINVDLCKRKMRQKKQKLKKTVRNTKFLTFL